MTFWRNAQLKLTRLHYIQATTEEKAATCKAKHSNNRWKPKGRASWFSEYTPVQKVMELLNSLDTDTTSVYEVKQRTNPNNMQYQMNIIGQQ